jgi:hypothetical protein
MGAGRDKVRARHSTEWLRLPPFGSWASDLNSYMLLWCSGRLLVLSARPGKQRLLDDHQIGQSKRANKVCSCAKFLNRPR